MAASWLQSHALEMIEYMMDMEEAEDGYFSDLAEEMEDEDDGEEEEGDENEEAVDTCHLCDVEAGSGCERERPSPTVVYVDSAVSGGSTEERTTASDGMVSSLYWWINADFDSVDVPPPLRPLSSKIIQPRSHLIRCPP